MFILLHHLYTLAADPLSTCITTIYINYHNIFRGEVIIQLLHTSSSVTLEYALQHYIFRFAMTYYDKK